MPNKKIWLPLLWKLQKLFGIGEIFDKSKDRTFQRKAIIDWIHKHLHESVNQFGSLGITPIVPRTGLGFVVFDFLNTSDTSNFDGTVSRKRNNKDTWNNP